MLLYYVNLLFRKIRGVRMMKHMNKKKIRLILLLLAVIFIPIIGGVKSEAATTCKSKISYPGVTTGQVNMRKKAGTNYKSYGLIGKNQSVTILGYTKNKGTTWYKCKAVVNGKKKTGYVSSSYVKKVTPATGTVNSKVISYLNVRKSAKTSAKSLLKIPKNTKVTIKGISQKSGKYWYKIKVTYNKKTKTGYVMADYITVSQNTSSNTSNNNSNSVDNSSTAKAGYVNDKVSSCLNVRKDASITSSILLRIPRNTVVSVLETKGDWYKVNTSYGGKTVTGYVSKEYITLGTVNSNNNTNTNNNTNNNTNTNTNTDTSFETQINNFPESYKASLRTLHTNYPNWRFVAIDTNLEWSDVIKNESIVGRNVIQSNYPKGTSSLAPFSYLSTAEGAYNWKTDTYTVKDGTNWYSASSEVIAYYMDPRNFLNDTDIFQFEALAYDASHSISVVQSILSNTFMKGSYSVTDSATNKKVSGTYKQAFMDAGKSAQANPYFLAARSKQEVGVNGSNATTGTYKGYVGIYNFYNIGAYDGTNAVANGLKWASGGDSKATTYGRPWTTPYKSIVGGAQYIAKNYINQGQNTLYFQKFNVKPVNTNMLYMHQYMTNVQAPYSEGRTTRAAYNNMGILSDTMIFYIPVYKNMPASACALPKTSGNPNPYLSSIKLYKGSTATEIALTPTYSYNTYTYSVAVPKSVSSVTVKASTISKRASVTGAGTYQLTVGETTEIKVVGKAENGNTQTYTIKVTRNTQ